MTTTLRHLDERASTHHATLNSDDPLVIANALIDHAIELQDAGHWVWAEAELAKAEAVLEAAKS